MKRVFFFVLSTILYENSWAGAIESTSRDGRVLPFLAVVSFPNVECNVGSGSMKSTGLCYSKKQCTMKGGTELPGSCAHGYGVCCSFNASCAPNGGRVIIETNLTRIVGTNPANACDFEIPKQPDVCQIRLDFNKFELGEYKHEDSCNSTTTKEGNCVNDKLSISPTQNLSDGIDICGDATGQHLYLHYGNHEKVTLSFTQTEMNQIYDIKVTMIKCNSPLKAPQGCTQYHREKTSEVKSFNYPNMQLNNHQYSVCIDNTDGKNQIQWRTCPPVSDQQSPLSVSGMLVPTEEKRGVDNCVRDYIILPGTTYGRYCGGNLDNVKSSVTPFILRVNFDDSEKPKELIPTPYINPETGCPLGFTCSSGDDCKDPGLPAFCIPPNGYEQLIDNCNIGFCLEYDI